MNSSRPKFKIIIGLGNPDLPAGRHGKQYENTYHNAGFLFINFLIKNRQNYQLPITNYQLLKSDVYMNESGIFVSKIIKKNGIKPENLIIAHDDSDILLGDYKLSFDRSSAGHKGIESIIKSLGTQKFWRLRIGIRPLPQINANLTQTNAEKLRQRKSAANFQVRTNPRLKAGEFVLKKITVQNKKIIDGVFQKITQELFN